MLERDSMYKCSFWQIRLLICCMVITALVLITWNISNKGLNFPPNDINLPNWWANRSNGFLSIKNRIVYNQLFKKKILDLQSKDVDINILEPKRKLFQMRLVCYYSSTSNETFNYLPLKRVPADLCSHINIGFASLRNCSISLGTMITQILKEDVPYMRSKNPKLKILLSIGGAESGVEFAVMVKNHESRKRFLQSLIHILSEYALDGVDLDFEFPSAYNKERQHFSQLLYEIKAEYSRERKDYLLTVAVAAPEGIAVFAYDVSEINKYADYVNLMAYDFHFYSKTTPFTGMNSPLYGLPNERSILATLNINHSVNFWLQKGLSREKLVVGLPTYGHSYTLVNPLNTGIGAPAQGFGSCGNEGFVSYSELCWFCNHNFEVFINYNKETCSPYLSSGTEWISFENEESLTCKTRYIKSNNLGGAMVFSINTDDTKQYCNSNVRFYDSLNLSFPLINIVKKSLIT